MNDTRSRAAVRDLRTLFIVSAVGVIASIFVFAVAMLMMIISDFSSESAGRTMMVASIALGGSLGLAGATAGMMRPRLKQLSSAAVVIVIIATFQYVLRAMSMPEFAPSYPASSSEMTVFALQSFIYFGGLALAHLCFMLSLPIAGRFLNIMRWVVIAMAWIVVSSMTASIVAVDLGPSGVFIFTSFLGMWCTILGTIAVPMVVLARGNRTYRGQETIDDGAAVALSCPKCNKEMIQRPGFFRCSGCRTRLLLEVEEPRCACGYVLFNLTGSRCPECGGEIPANLLPAARGIDTAPAGG